MKLSKVVYLNLEVHKERDKRMREWLRDAEVPDNRIIRHEGKDAAHYDTVEEIVKAAEADGFPEFNNLLSPDLSATWAAQLGYIGCRWAFRSMLRYVASQNPQHAYLALTDKAEILKHFSEFERIVENAGEFDIIQFCNLIPRNNSRFDREIENMLTPTPCAFDPDFIYGIPYPGDQACLYSPEGARKMLEFLSRDGNQIFSIDSINHFFNSKYGYGGVWRVISVKPDIPEPWVRRHFEDSYHKILNQRKNT